MSKNICYLETLYIYLYRSSVTFSCGKSDHKISQKQQDNFSFSSLLFMVNFSESHKAFMDQAKNMMSSPCNLSTMNFIKNSYNTYSSHIIALMMFYENNTVILYNS